jgi:nucleotide-binding universal stress UspA family protein
MLRILVVPLDGSALAERALPYAVRLARARGGRLVLVRVALAPPPTGFDWERQQLAEVEEARRYLSGVAEKLSTLGLPIETVTPYGRAAVQILETVEELEADGVVMATHGRTGLAHLTHGSVAEGVLAKSAVPVLLIQARPGEAPAPPFDPATARLLVALDGSTFAEAAVPAAIDVLGPSGELVLVRVVPPPDHVERDGYGRVLAYLDQQEEAATREARDYLGGVARQIAQDYPRIPMSVDVRVGEPARGIAVAVVDRSAELVVMATHGRTGLSRAVLGSVAGAVLRTGSMPVLLVRPPHAAQEGAERVEAALPGMSVTF